MGRMDFWMTSRERTGARVWLKVSVSRGHVYVRQGK
jgi:hypothetical protein